MKVLNVFGILNKLLLFLGIIQKIQTHDGSM
jgi:hypothetical protein